MFEERLNTYITIFIASIFNTYSYMEKDKIGVLIVESDADARNELAKALEADLSISFVENAENTDDALLKVIEQNPDVIFFEYPLVGKTGSGIIKFIQSKLSEINIIFVSKTTNYAVDAIHYEIYDYLLKPISKTSLKLVLDKVRQRKQVNLESRINEIIEQKQEDKRLRLNTAKGILIINPEDILYCKSDASYTELHLTNKSMELTYMSLLKIEEILLPMNFFRISRSILANRNYLRKMHRTECIFVLSANGIEYELKGSKTQVKAFIKTEIE